MTCSRVSEKVLRAHHLPLRRTDTSLTRRHLPPALNTVLPLTHVSLEPFLMLSHWLQLRREVLLALTCHDLVLGGDTGCVLGADLSCPSRQSEAVTVCGCHPFPRGVAGRAL